MHPLARVALALCPREYRTSYGATIARDAANRRASWVAIAADLAYHGLAMRVEILARDVAFAVRTLAKAPLYALVTIATIALATGPNIVVAGILSAALQSLPYPNADRLAVVGLRSGGPETLSSLSYPDANDIDARSRTLEPLALAEPDNETLLTGARPRILRGNIVSGNYFALLGARALVGRLVEPGDAGRTIAVISESVWRTDFGGDPHVVGRRLRFASGTFTIVGVVPAAFREPLDPRAQIAASRFWLPLDPRSGTARGRGNWAYNAFALLRPGVTLAQARTDLDRVVRELVRAYPVNHVGTTGGGVVPLYERIVGESLPLLRLLAVAVLAVLAIACVNLANLAFGRAAARDQELVVRSALGAGRARLAAQLATEAAVLATCGALAGIVLAAQSLRAIAPIAVRTLPRWEDAQIDGSALAYAVAMTALVTVCTGVFPALARRRDIADALKAGGRSGDRSRRAALRAAFVIAQVALAITVAVTAGLVTRSFARLVHTPTGFSSDRVALIYVSDLPPRYANADARAQFIARVRRALVALPGVTAAASARELPFAGASTTGFTIPGRPAAQGITHINEIQPQYFEVLRIPLLAGRAFTAADRRDSRPVAIVNATFARRFFGTLDVLGRQVLPGQWDYGPAPPPRTIVGVAADTRSAFDQFPAPQVFVPVPQVPRVSEFALRTTAGVAGLQDAVANAVTSVDRDVAPSRLYAMDDIMALSAFNARAATILFATLAGIALLLALAGSYAVSAYSVSGRIHEFGIRKAVGARNAAVLHDVLGKALGHGLIGIGVGIALAAAVTKLLASLLYETSPLDPPTFAGVIALMTAITVLASLIPAVSAMRVEPATALRYE